MNAPASVHPLANSNNISPPSWNSDNPRYVGAGFPPNRSAGDWGRCDIDENVRRDRNQSNSNQWEQQKQNDHDSRRCQNQMSRRDNLHPPSRPSQPQQHEQNDSYSQQQTRQHHGGKQQFAVLYTHQKIKKKKSWKDGRLVWVGGRATLYDANPMPGGGDAALDSTEVSFSEIQRLANGECANLESEKYLIQIEGPWTSAGAWSTQDLPSKIVGSAGMNKVMGKKFQIPSRKMPNFEEQRRLKMEKENKRRRVLQPGELERMYYRGGDSFSGNDNRWHDGNSGNEDSHGHGGGNGCGSKGNGGGFQENLGQSNNNVPSTGRSQYNDFRHNFVQEDNRGPDDGYNNSRDNNNTTKSGMANGFQHIEKARSNIPSGNYNNDYRKGGHYSHRNNNHGYDDHDTIAYDNRQNFSSFGPSQRNFDESRFNGPQTSQSKGERNNGRCQNFHEVNPGFISEKEPQPFQSNELDPSGFYEEEDDDGEDAGMGWVGNDQVTNIQHKQPNDVNYSRASVGGSIDFNSSHHPFSSQNSKQNEYDQVNANECVREHFSNSHPNETRLGQSGSHNQPKSSQMSSRKVCPVTDTLNALFGATTATDEETCSPHGYCNESSRVGSDRDMSNKDSTKPCYIQGNGDINRSKAHNNSFLAGFIEAEENLNDDTTLAGRRNSDYESDSRQYEDIDVQQGHDYGNYDLDCTKITNYREGGKEMHIAPNDVSTHETAKELGVAQISGLSLPSAGESSSEENDSLSEEP